MLKTSLALLLCLSSTAALAQGMLPANSEVPLVLDQEVSSKRMKVGDGFDVSVARDVWSGDRIVIPRGARGRGVVVWKTGKGAFGKSGKMEIELRSVEVGGQLVPLSGKFRQEGEGNTAATVGTIVAAGVIAGLFVTGHSAVFAQGTELKGMTSAPFAAVGAPPAAVTQVAHVPVVVAPATQVAQAPVVVAPAVALASVAPVAPPRPAIFVTPAAPVAVVAAPMASVAVVKPAPAVAVVTVAPPAALVSPVARPVVIPVTYASAAPLEDKSIRYAQLLRAQQGFRGRNAQQGWTISD